MLAYSTDNPDWKHCYLHPQDTHGALIQVFEENAKTLAAQGSVSISRRVTGRAPHPLPLRPLSESPNSSRAASAKADNRATTSALREATSCFSPRSASRSYNSACVNLRCTYLAGRPSRPPGLPSSVR